MNNVSRARSGNAQALSAGTDGSTDGVDMMVVGALGACARRERQNGLHSRDRQLPNETIGRSPFAPGRGRARAPRAAQAGARRDNGRRAAGAWPAAQPGATDTQGKWNARLSAPPHKCPEAAAARPQPAVVPAGLT